MLELNQKICKLYEHKLVKERLGHKDSIITTQKTKTGRELEKVPEEYVK